MIQFRPFRNNDTPLLAEIWRTHPPRRGLMQPMSTALFELMILSKPYFDRRGLIVATDDGRPIGFGHAGFGPNEQQTDLCCQWGVTYLIMVRADYLRQGVGAQLLEQCENYLRSRGAQVIYGGGIAPLSGFYLGLYGGSELPGILDSSPDAQALFQSHGYVEIDRTSVQHLELVPFRPKVDRQQLQWRRSSTLRVLPDPPSKTWWEACVWGVQDRTRFELISRENGDVLASCVFWNLQPLAAGWGVHAQGLVELEVNSAYQRQGLATFLLGEAFRHFQQNHYSLVEVQTMRSNQAALELYKKLGFREIDQGVVLRRG